MNTKVRTSISFWSLCCALFFTALATIGLSSVAEAQWNISVTPSTTNVTAGTNLSYEITAGNTSIFTRNNAKATITLPFTALPGMKSVFHVADNVSCDTSAAPVIVCPLGNVSALSSKTFRITVKVSDGYVVATNGAGFISFPVQVSADSGSSSTANSPVVNVNELADLKVSQFSSSLNPRAGDVFTYSIYVDNFGPSAARGVELYTVIGTGGLSPEQKVSVQSCAFSVSQGCGAITQFSCTTGEVSLGQFLANIGKFATDHLRPVTNEDATCGADPGSNNPVGRIRGSFRIVAPEDMDMTGMVSVESSTPDEDYSDNQGSQLYDITGVSDVSINKTATGEVLVDGEEGLPYNVIIGAPFPEAPTFTTSSLVVTQGRRVRYEIG